MEAHHPIDLVLASAGGSISKKWLSTIMEQNALMIDNSSAFRLDNNVPLIVPEVNVLFQVFFPHWKQFSFLCLSQILPPLSEHGLLKGPFLQRSLRHQRRIKEEVSKQNQRRIKVSGATYIYDGVFNLI